MPRPCRCCRTATTCGSKSARSIPEDRGRIVTAFLESFFRRYVEYGFTADLEEKLDLISAGELSWKEVLRDFWIDFTRHVTEIKDLRVSEVLDALNDLLADHIFPAKADGSQPAPLPDLRHRPAVAEARQVRRLHRLLELPRVPPHDAALRRRDRRRSRAATPISASIPTAAFACCSRSGRFGPYVQLGDGEEPKRSSPAPGWNAGELTLDRALQLLSLPREVGPHPQTGSMITAGIGRYGPFVLHDGKYANLPDVEEVFTVGANRAVDLLAAKAAGGFRRGGGAAVAAIKTFEHADGPISVRAGRYGPYVNQGKVNATLPKTLKPEDVTLEQALELIVAKGGASPKKAAKKAPAKKATAKKATAKKAAAKKAPAKKAGAQGEGRSGIGMAKEPP